MKTVFFAMMLFLLISSCWSETLTAAIEAGNLQAVKDLIHKKVNVDAVDEKEGVTPLIFAVMFGRDQIVKELVKAGADVNKVESANHATPLMWASIVNPGKISAKKGLPIPSAESKVAIVKMLLERDAKVNTQNSWGGTALQWAADAGVRQIVEMLLKAGAKPEIADHEGLTPLMAAVNYDSDGHVQIAKLLLESGAKLETRNQNGDTALLYAVNPLDAKCVNLLIQASADVNVQNQEGLTPLMKASQLSRIDAMKSLIRAGANLNAKTKSGETVLAVAKRAGYEPAIQLLIESGAK